MTVIWISFYHTSWKDIWETFNFYLIENSFSVSSHTHDAVHFAELSWSFARLDQLQVNFLSATQLLRKFTEQITCSQPADM